MERGLTMPEPDLHLDFDVYARLSAVIAALADFSSDIVVLDVGGHPGILARSIRQFCRAVTIDLPSDGSGFYVRGGGRNLPFASGAFDAVTASDVLEHIAVDARESFVLELARVARRDLILSGPWDTPGVAAAERQLAAMRDAAGMPADRWLDEHLRNGLPSLGTTIELLRSNGWYCTVKPCNDLTRWLMMFAAKILSEVCPGGDLAWSQLMPDFNRDIGALGTGPLTYAHILVATRNKGADLVLDDVAAADTEAADRVMTALGSFYCQLIAQMSTFKNNARGGEDIAYVEQIERALARVTEELAQSRRNECKCCCKTLRHWWQRLRAGKGVK